MRTVPMCAAFVSKCRCSAPITKSASAVILLFMALADPVWAQTPTLTAATTLVSPGQTVSAVVSGPPGQFFAVVGSSVNAGFSYAGVELAVGPDVAILATGTLNSAGQAAVVLQPPFRGSVLDRYYLQAATSPSPAFAPLSPSPSVVVKNADISGTVGAMVNPDGTTQFASAGVTVTRLSLGQYRINVAPGAVTTPTFPMFTVIGARILAIFHTPTQINLTLDADAFFHFAAAQLRP